MFNPLLSPACFDTPEFLSGVSAWVRHIPAAFALVEALRPRVFVELGTHHGDSYSAFCQAVAALGTGTQCFAVDKWTGDEHSGFYGPEVLSTLEKHNASKFANFSTLIQSEFDAARSRFADGSIDLLHIDGYHSYEAVKHDFETWLPALSDRGVVLFHDTRVRERAFGVWRLWEELAARYEHIEMRHAHGLGVLAVGRNHSGAFRSMLAAAQTAPCFDRFFDTLGLRVELSVKVTQQQARIAQLEQRHAEAIAQVSELRSELERQAHRMLVEQHAENAAQWQARADKMQQFLEQTQAIQQGLRVEQETFRAELRDVRGLQGACVGELQEVRSDMHKARGELQEVRSAQQESRGELRGTRSAQQEVRNELQEVRTAQQELRGDLGQVISNLERLQLFVEDQAHLVQQVVNRWRASFLYRCVRKIYREMARVARQLSGRPKPSAVAITDAAKTGPESSPESIRRAA